MSYRLVVVATGTEVGKTTTAVALLRAARGLGLRAAGWKPVESGGTSDGDALQAASDAPCPTTLQLADPISPHLAARRAGRAIDLPTLVACAPAAEVDLLVVETAGGLFSPLTERGETNAELATALAPDGVLLVAPNRLGVLHDVTAVVRAAPALISRLVAVALTGGAASDPSAASNAAELARLLRLTVWSLPTPASTTTAMLEWLRARRRR